MEVTLVVSGCIVLDRQILLAKKTRSGSPETIGLWEMPGGKVEKGETMETALVRELEEELGMVVHVRELLHAQVNTFSNDIPYLVLFYRCDVLGYKGTGENLETKWCYYNAEEFNEALPGAKEALTRLIAEGKY